VLSGGVITMEDKNGRSALSQGTVVTPTKVKATLASIPIATESLISRGVSSLSLRLSAAVVLIDVSYCSLHYHCLVISFFSLLGF